MTDIKTGFAISGKDLKIGKNVVNSPATLDKLIAGNQEKIMELQNIFPFDFFPDKIIISKTKVDLIYGVFFFSDQVLSMMIRDIKNVKLMTGILFAGLSFELQGYEVNPPKIKFLSIAQAMKARRIIEGLIACEAKGVDLSSFTTLQLEEKLEELGRARGV